MIPAFRYEALPMRVVFGAGSSEQLPGELDQLGMTRVAVLCSGDQADAVRDNALLKPLASGEAPEPLGSGEAREPVAQA